MFFNGPFRLHFPVLSTSCSHRCLPFSPPPPPRPTMIWSTPPTPARAFICTANGVRFSVPAGGRFSSSVAKVTRSRAFPRPVKKKSTKKFIPQIGLWLLRLRADSRSPLFADFVDSEPVGWGGRVGGQVDRWAGVRVPGGCVRTFREGSSTYRGNEGWSLSVYLSLWWIAALSTSGSGFYFLCPRVFFLGRRLVGGSGWVETRDDSVGRFRWPAWLVEAVKTVTVSADSTLSGILGWVGSCAVLCCCVHTGTYVIATAARALLQ